MVGGIGQLLQADLADMQALSRKNKGTKYISTGIDVFSKYASAIPVKNKRVPEMKNDLELLFQISNPGKPDKSERDTPKEFLNTDV